MTMTSDTSVRIARAGHLAPKVVFVDGIEGCGKTMLSPILSALDRAELLTYAYEIEHVCSLRYLGKLDGEAAATTISMLADLRLYNLMQSREVNFRPSDLSSVFRASHPLKYIRRLFQPGDRRAAERIPDENPILFLTTHRLIAYGEPLLDAFSDRLVFVEVVRHPLYMIIQNTLNYSGLIGTARDFTIYYDYRGTHVPYFVRGWEDRFLSSNFVERAIYSIRHLTSRSQAMRASIEVRGESRIVTVPFERFVLDPDPYMKTLEDVIGTQVTPATRRMLAKQRVPRAKYADSLNLAVYRRCGWEPPKPGLSEREEFEHRRLWAERQVSTDAMLTLDALCDEYEATFMGGSLRPNGGRYA